MKPYYPLLLKMPLFDGIQADDLQALHQCLDFRTRKYQKDEAVILEGDEVKKLGIVLSGSMLVVKDDIAGNRSIISHVMPGNQFGESFALANQKKSIVSVFSSEDSEVLFIDAQRILTVCEKLCSYHNQLIYNVMRSVAEKNIGLNEKIEMLSQKTTRGKLMSYLSMEAKRQNSLNFEISFNRQQLADFLFVDRSALSAELSKMRKEGILDYRKNHFQLKLNSSVF